MDERTQPERINLDRLRGRDRGGRAKRAPVGAGDFAPDRPLARLVGDWPGSRPLIVCDESGAGPPIAEALQACCRKPGRGVGRPGRRLRRKRSLTLSVNFPLLRGWGSAPGCCAPRPPLSPPWRYFRRSPVTGRHPLVELLSRPMFADGMPRAACQVRRACTDRRSPTSGSSSTSRAGNKPPADWRVGTEHEKFVFRRADLRPGRPMTGPTASALLQA